MLRELKTFSILSLGIFTWAIAPLSFGQGLPAEGEDAAVPEPLFLTVSDVVARLEAASPAVLIEKETVRRALHQSYQSRAALYPSLSLNVEQSRQQYGLDSTRDPYDGPPFNAFSSRVTGNLSVFNTQNYADYRLARMEHRIATMDYEVALQDFISQALQVYFTQLRDIRRIEIVESNLVRERELLELARQQYDAGVAIKIDVTRAEVRLATERRSLMEARTQAENSMLQLKALLDLDLDGAVLLDRSVIDGIKAPPSLKRYGSMEALTEMRPELSGQQERVDQAILARKAAGWQRLPTVDLFADWGYDSGEPFDDNEGEAWLVGIRASMPLFEGFRIRAEKREATAAVRQAQFQMTRLRNEIEREFRYALIEMESRYDQIEIAREEVRLGRDEVDQAGERYREGLADNRELIDAQQRLSDAENSHLQAIYLYGLSRLAFARAIGSAQRVLE
ncbi:TolC family protein [Coraliomargarita parva]|uniref:TolC family protein n=1 Tax=Coraliomargarita parva TaxID=3014050 RepID=UPI0022B3C9FD|nr:TolC family protein [Coraliomargarita parva]